MGSFFFYILLQLNNSIIDSHFVDDICRIINEGQADQSSAKTKEDARKSPENFIKNPLIADFLQFHQNSRYTETQLEQALIDNLQQFILELGKGYDIYAVRRGT